VLADSYQVEAALAEAAKERSPAALEAALALAASKPGVKIPLIASTKALLVRVSAEFPVSNLPLPTFGWSNLFFTFGPPLSIIGLQFPCLPFSPPPPPDPMRPARPQVLELLRGALKTKRQADLTRAIDAAEALDLEFMRIAEDAASKVRACMLYMPVRL